MASENTAGKGSRVHRPALELPARRGRSGSLTQNMFQNGVPFVNKAIQSRGQEWFSAVRRSIAGRVVARFQPKEGNAIYPST